MLTLTSLLTFSASSCVHRPVVAPPPLPSKPVLASICADRNDRTGELGAWMSVEDLRVLAKYINRVETVREVWK